MGPLPCAFQCRPEAGGQYVKVTAEPVPTWPLPMSGCTYPGCGEAVAPGVGVGSGTHTFEQAKAGVVAAAKRPTPTTAITATAASPISSVR
jgi:hypothetical protein